MQSCYGIKHLPVGMPDYPAGQGGEKLESGQITFVVLAREATQEPNRLLFASVGLARPKNRKQYGYISEHHGFGQTHKKASDFAEDLAATMLAATLGIEFDRTKIGTSVKWSIKWANASS